MINVKLLVLFSVHLNWFIAFGKLPVPKPSESCVGYDYTALLTEEDPFEITNRINEKRNHVALGLSKKLPKAANMRKVEWSDALATDAQRWVDQCNALTLSENHHRPDLLNNQGEYNIASIFGPAPGLTVKSFVDIWYTQITDYNGSVYYYNRTQDSRTNYFTQLIWAGSDHVGCGKSRFFTEEGTRLIERLACKFSPKGNIHGKPVYIVGYSATQCPDNMEKDSKFTALCRPKNVKTFLSKKPAVSSLLRIINLTSNATTQEIDPININIDQRKLESNQTQDLKYQKIRHVQTNHSYVDAAIPLIRPQLHPPQMPWNFEGFSTSDRRYQQEGRGHSRLYHGHELRDKTASPTLYSANQGFRRFEFTELPLNVLNLHNHRRHNHYLECTRRQVHCEAPPKGCPIDICTRGSTCPTSTSCSCTQSTPCPTTKCRCEHDCCAEKCQPKMEFRRVGTDQTDNSKQEVKKLGDFHYYDLMPNMAVRSGLSMISRESAVRTTNVHDNLHNNLHAVKSTQKRHNKSRQHNYTTKQNKYIDRDVYDYGFERRKRQSDEQITFKPFWQMDEYNYNPSSLLKSLRYTTLSNRKNKKNTISQAFPTEVITIHSHDTNIPNEQTALTRERYLSFDELMHLRKFNMDENYNARRAPTTAKQSATKVTTKKNTATTKAKTTTAPKKTTHATTKQTKNTNATRDYTTNTVQKLLKQCTRRVTCTWTMVTMTANDGRIIKPGGGGSRTPPGYVEGCTRTSTCTRDFQNRNKVSSADVATSGDGQPEDEDYCERRSLNVRRRNSHIDQITESSVEQLARTDSSIAISYTTSTPTEVMSVSLAYQESTHDDSCVCSEESSRKKRYIYCSHKCDCKKSISYGELYYLVLNKIIQIWESRNSENHNINCACNNGPTQLCLHKIILVFPFLYLFK